MLKISERVKSGSPTTSEDVYQAFQDGIEKVYGVSLESMLDNNQMMVVQHGLVDLENMTGLKGAVELVKQTDMSTSTGAQPLLNNPVTGQIGQFGGASGVFNPAFYAQVLEGIAYKTIITKLWGIQPPASPNDLVAQILYLSKPAPISGSTEVYARVAEGRAGGDVGFELKSVNVDWGRRIVHTPVTYEVERVMANRFPLQATIANVFAELYATAQDNNAFAQWYQALDAGTLEGDALALYTDGAIADVDGMPAGYKCFYQLSTGKIAAGDSQSFGAATVITASGADIADLIYEVFDRMTSANTGYRTNARFLYTPDYVALPQSAVVQLMKEIKDGNLLTFWIDKMDVSMWSQESGFVGRMRIGSNSIDIWSIPDWVSLGKNTTDSPVKAISAGFAGRYQFMGAYSDLTGPMLTVDKDFEVKTVGGVNVLRDRKANVHTMFSLNAERLLNASMSFLIKFVP